MRVRDDATIAYMQPTLSTTRLRLWSAIGATAIVLALNIVLTRL
jgi:hypothetical protein